jgi:hypothetical protein
MFHRKKQKKVAQTPQRAQSPPVRASFAVFSFLSKLPSLLRLEFIIFINFTYFVDWLEGSLMENVREAFRSTIELSLSSDIACGVFFFFFFLKKILIILNF